MIRLRTARDMLGTADLEAHWKQWADRRQLPLRTRPGTVAAYVNDGRWVADCPECNGGIACDPDYDRGCCLDCGTITKIRFPAQDDIDAAVWALGVRPPDGRNWNCHRGETVADLRGELIRRGIKIPLQAFGRR